MTSKKIKTLFLGHGSPMNVLIKNQFNLNFKIWGERLKISNPLLKGIVFISAHYQTSGIKILNLDSPPIIHDYDGFPRELYEMKYPAKGDSILSEKLYQLLKNDGATKVTNWGLDHGAWNVLYHLIPEANIPVVMLSIDYNRSFEEHFELGLKLNKLTDDGYLLIALKELIFQIQALLIVML
jgi:4,5-DOPA dioxygenase extradiol